METDMTNPKRLMSLADEFDYERYTRQDFEEMRELFRENTECVYRMHDEILELLKPRPGSRTAAELADGIEAFSTNRQIIEEQFEEIEHRYERRLREKEDREEEERRIRLLREEEAERREDVHRPSGSGIYR